MKTRGIVGRKIVAVHQGRFRHSSGHIGVEVLEIELDNGTLLRPIAYETDEGDDYPVDLIVVKPKKRKHTKEGD